MLICDNLCVDMISVHLCLTVLFRSTEEEFPILSNKCAEQGSFWWGGFLCHMMEGPARLDGSEDGSGSKLLKLKEPTCRPKI